MRVFCVNKKLLFAGCFLCLMLVFAVCASSADIEFTSIDAEPDIIKAGEYVTVTVNYTTAPGVEAAGYSVGAYVRDVPPEAEDLGWEFREAASPHDRPYWNSYRIAPHRSFPRVSGEGVLTHAIDTEGWPVGDYLLRLTVLLFREGRDLYRPASFAFTIVEEELLEQLREPVSERPASDGSIFTEDFEGVDVDGVPEAWDRHVQTVDGAPQGIAGVSGRFAGRTFLLRDGSAHIAAWSVSDEVLPEDNRWAVQFDIYPASGLYAASDAGAVFGLKRGVRGSEDFLPLIQMDNDSTRGKPIALLGLGEVMESNLTPDRWHRIVISREGTTWEFYLNDELKNTVPDADTDLRGYAFGSFRSWEHRAMQVYFDNFRIGRFTRE